MADERDRVADERERAADEREGTADERERAADKREVRQDSGARAAGQPDPSYRERSFEAIVRARRLMGASQDHLDRREAALRREDGRDAREQAAIERETDASSARQASEGPEPREVLEARAGRIQERLVSLAHALGATEVALAEEYERLAVEQPHHSAEFRRRAELCREVAADLDAVCVKGAEIF
ncbi:hypothetical protein [Streptomyces sp. BH104]|uniref:hypothetical protein n=1 Tax=Streptomyces sp. BH104 TaxID=3410407 RepID=UPI003BB74468